MDEHMLRLMQDFGQQLRQHREEHQGKLSQKEVADVAGVSRATYSRWECGQALPDREHVSELDAYYKLDGRLIARYDFVLQPHTTLPILRTWAAPVKPPGYTGELHLLFRVPDTVPPMPTLDIQVDVDGHWRLQRGVGPVDEAGVAIVGSEPDPIRRTIEVVTSKPVLIALGVGYPPLPPDRVTGIRMADWTILPPRSTADT